MSRLLPTLLLTVLAAACQERPDAAGAITATLDGYVYVTGPVAGARVAAHVLDLETGAQGDFIAESAPTDTDGSFHLELGNYHGPVLLTAHGADARFVEPATGVQAPFEASTELRAVYVEAGAPLTLELDSGGAGTAVITPWSEWAYASSLARRAAFHETTYADALRHALGRFRDHVEYDYWSVAPSPLAEAHVGAWSSRVQAGLLLAALSTLTSKMAEASSLSPAGLSTLSLVTALRDDLSDRSAVLDGIGSASALKVGTCAILCPLGPLTLRAQLADAARAFLGAATNKSGIAVADASALLDRIAARESDLWPSAAAPTVTWVASSFRDDTGVAASVEGPGVGTIRYSGEGAAVTIAPGTSLHFTKFPGRYTAGAEHLPEVHFAVDARHVPISAITLRARLSRLKANGETVLLADWFPVGPATAADFNRALVLSSVLHADLGLVPGTYVLEFRASDGLGHESLSDCKSGVGCLSWSQTLLAPPLRQRQGTDDPVCSDLKVPTGHALLGSSCGNTFAYTAIANLTDTRKIALGLIDNPNPTPVQVTLAATAHSAIRRGLGFRGVHVETLDTLLLRCDKGLGPQTPLGACFMPNQTVREYGADDVLDRDLATDVAIDGAAFIGKTAAGARIFEIPALSTATVWILSPSFRFLMPEAAMYYATLGDAEHVTGFTGIDWIDCVNIYTNTKFDPPLEACREQWRFRETTYLTRASVHPRSKVTLTVRPAGSAEAVWGAATGTGIADFNYHDFSWDTAMAGFQPF